MKRNRYIKHNTGLVTVYCTFREAIAFGNRVRSPFVSNSRGQYRCVPTQFAIFSQTVYAIIDVSRPRLVWRKALAGETSRTSDSFWYNWPVAEAARHDLNSLSVQDPSSLQGPKSMATGEGGEMTLSTLDSCYPIVDCVCVREMSMARIARLKPL